MEIGRDGVSDKKGEQRRRQEGERKEMIEQHKKHKYMRAMCTLLCVDGYGE